MQHIRDLTPDPTNARRHTSHNVGTIENALHEVGAARSIVIDENGVVLAGNATIEAAAAAGIERLQVIDADGETIIAVRRSNLTPEQKRRLALFDNRAAELAEWDTEVLAAMVEDGADMRGLWSDDELAALLEDEGGTEGLTDADAVPEPPSDPITKPGDLWTLGEHRVLCGDATIITDVEHVMAGERAEMAWTDPPYGVAIGDKNQYLNSIARSNRVEENLHNDTLDERALDQMLRDAFGNAVTVCTAGAAWYVAAPAVPLHVIFGHALKDLGIWRQTIQWVKNNATFSPLGVCYHWQAEPIFFGWTPGAAHRYYGDRTQTTVWEIDRPSKSPEHPTMKPVELVARAVRNSSQSNEWVLDPFGGSGSSLIACEETARRCAMIEIDPKYCDVIVERWQNFTGQSATRESAS